MKRIVILALLVCSLPALALCAAKDDFTLSLSLKTG